MTKMTLEEALERIKVLEEECAKLRIRIEQLEEIKPGGRKPHDGKWQANYNHFVELYESGDTIPMIIEKTSFSRRTVYRYKSYYDGKKKGNEQ